MEVTTAAGQRWTATVTEVLDQTQGGLWPAPRAVLSAVSRGGGLSVERAGIGAGIRVRVTPDGQGDRESGSAVDSPRLPGGIVPHLRVQGLAVLGVLPGCSHV